MPSLSRSNLILIIVLLVIGFVLVKKFIQKGQKSLKMRPTRKVKPIDQVNDQEIKKATVIFDLNGVLFTVNKQQALSQLGLLDTLSYTLSGKKTEDLEQKIFDVLHKMQPQFNTFHCTHPDEHNKNLVPLHNKQPLPHVMRDWIQGELDGETIIDKAVPFIDQLDEQEFFSSAVEKKLVKKTLQMIFDPKTRCRLCQPIKSGIKLAKKCKELGHNVYLLSNMDSEFITLLKEKHPDVFEIFDGMVISADERAIKPYAKIYDTLITRYKLNPKQCYLIDDQEENLHGAQLAGITGIQCDHNHFIEVRRILRSHGILPSKKDEQLDA